MRCRALLFLALCMAPVAAAAAGRASWPSVRYRLPLARADTLMRTDRARGYAWLDSLIAVARVRGDRGLEMTATLRRATSRGYLDFALDEARADTRPWLPFAQASGDTESWCRALRTLGFADLVQQRWASAEPIYAQMLRLAHAARLTSMEGYANSGVSFIAIQHGHARAAERGYRAAFRQLTATHDPPAARMARAGLANALLSQTRPDEARREYEGVLADARAVGDRRNELDALNDLGALEFLYGDPSRAADYYRAAIEGNRALGRTDYVAVELRNLGNALLAQGRADEACALLDSVVRAAVANGNVQVTAQVLVDIAVGRRMQGRLAEAESAARRSLALRDSVGVGTWEGAVSALGSVLLASGRADEARKLFSDALSSRDVLPPNLLTDVLVGLGKAENASGHPTRAIERLREAAAVHAGKATSGTYGDERIDLEAELGRAFLALGRRDSAIAHFQLASAVWERQRAVPDDPAWREQFGGVADRLFGPYAAALLDPARGDARTAAAEAFAALQPFRARTLEDALRGAEGRTAPPRIELAALQHRVLRPGEVFVDCFVAPETTFVFAVTREAIQVAGAAGLVRLRPRLARLRDVLASPAADPGLIEASSSALGAELFGGIAAPLRASRTVLLSAGALDEMPLGMLRLPGEERPLAVGHELALVPSATLLAAGRGSGRGAAGSGLIALGRGTDAGGRPLSGVAREIRWLRGVPGASVRENDGRKSLEEMLRGLERGAIVHVAAHTRASGSAPWRSGFLLGRGGGEDAYLTASRISRLKLAAGVCVLASCTSAGPSGGEGIPNLAAAWLSAGSRAVIATQWAQDDEATASFVERFYSQLRLGRTIGEALRESQRLTREGSRNVRLRDWAGYVLIGDPTTRVSLAPARVRATTQHASSQPLRRIPAVAAAAGR
jgi:tetratricopeptide (TPR) repeat protein